jgi:DNA (cytosine-5)-methyltransferase 1
VRDVPEHDILVGGFPCQPFSKSGKQMGMEETRGTLFWNIAKIIEARKPSLVLLENVQNIVGPRHLHEWNVIIQTLRDLGYRVSENPMVVSPHLIKREFGGRPQVRNRVFIAATLIPKGMPNFKNNVEIPSLDPVIQGWDPQNWNLERDLPLDKFKASTKQGKIALTESEVLWIEAWNDFVLLMRQKLKGEKLPGFPIWVDAWVEKKDLKIPRDTPAWKRNFLEKNSNFYTEHRTTLNKWLKKWDNLADFPPSRRKFEWQAQDAKSIADTILHFRPSGIRAKKATYVPALVAITQTSIIGKHKRRISVREAARLQGFPDWFDFLDQREGMSYKQLGNAVNIGAVYNVIKSLVIRDIDLLAKYPDLTKAILSAPNSPDDQLIEFKSHSHKERTDLSTTFQPRIVNLEA